VRQVAPVGARVAAAQTLVAGALRLDEADPAAADRQHGQRRVDPSSAVVVVPLQLARRVALHNRTRCLLGPFHWAIAVPSVTRCRCRGRYCRWRRRGHRFHIAIHQVSLLSHAACAIAIAGFGSSCLGSGVDNSVTW